MPGNYDDLGFVPTSAANPHADLGFVPKRAGPGYLETAVDHGVHGATLGFSDELAGAGRALGLNPEAVAQAVGDAGGNLSAAVLPLLGGAAQKLVGGHLTEDYRAGRDERRAQLEAEAKENPKTAMAAGLAGGIAPTLLLPGAGAGAGLGARVLHAAKTGAAVGAATGLGESKADLTAGDVGGAARDTAGGAALGGALGPAVELGISGAKALPAKLADYLKGIARNRAISAVGPTAGQVKKTLARGEDVKLADWLLENKQVRAGDTFEDVAKRLEASNAAAGAEKQAAVDALDMGGVKANPDLLADEIRQAAGAHDSPFTQDILSRFEKTALEAEKSGNRVPFSRADAWKIAAQSRPNYAKANPGAGAMGDEELASITRDWARDAAGPGPAGEQYRSALDKLHLGLEAEGMTEGAAARAAARNILSPSDKAAGALAAKNGGLLGLAAAISNKVVRGRAASTLAVSANTASDALRNLAATAPQKLGRFGPVLSRALQSGPEEFAAKQFVLANTDPDFQKLQADLAAEGK